MKILALSILLGLSSLVGGAAIAEPLESSESAVRTLGTEQQKERFLSDLSQFPYSGYSIGLQGSLEIGEDEETGIRTVILHTDHIDFASRGGVVSEEGDYFNAYQSRKFPQDPAGIITIVSFDEEGGIVRAFRLSVRELHLLKAQFPQYFVTDETSLFVMPWAFSGTGIASDLEALKELDKIKVLKNRYDLGIMELNSFYAEGLRYLNSYIHVPQK